MLKVFLLISLNEKNTAGPEVLSQTASEAGPGVGHSRAQQIIRETHETRDGRSTIS